MLELIFFETLEPVETHRLTLYPNFFCIAVTTKFTLASKWNRSTFIFVLNEVEGF